MTVKLEGFAALDKALAELPRATAGNVLVRTLLKAAEPMKDEMARLAPDDPRTGGYDLKTSIQAKRAKVSRYETQYTKTVDVGPFLMKERSLSGKEGGRWFASKALELGLGDMPLKPYVRPVFDAKKDEVLVIIGTELKAQIAKAVARRARRLGK